MDYRPVGIFDSGMGGLTAVRVLRELLPGEDIAYLGDTARVPYGGRSVAELIESARSDALPEIPLLDRVGDFFLNSCYPSDNGLLSLNFGDSSLHADGSRPLVWLRANGLGKPRHLWYLAQTANSSCKEAIPRNSPLGLVFYPSAEELANAPALPDLPTSALYPDMGGRSCATRGGKTRRCSP